MTSDSSQIAIAHVCQAHHRDAIFLRLRNLRNSKLKIFGAVVLFSPIVAWGESHRTVLEIYGVPTVITVCTRRLLRSHYG